MKNILAIWQLCCLALSQCLLVPLGVLLVMKTLRDEFTIYFVLSYLYCVSALSLHIESAGPMALIFKFLVLQ